MNRVYFLTLSILVGTLLTGHLAFGQLAIRNNIPLIINNTDTLSSAWGGGMNDPVWGQLELNGDNLLDLVVFDSYDNTFIPFVNQGGVKPRYEYAPEYYSAFKDCDCEYWARFKDYDHDGDLDIFCSANSNVSVYKNEPVNGRAQLQLEIFNLDAVYFGTQKLALFSSKVFLPDLEDIDQDGDLDFFTWPSFIRNSPEFYRNVGLDSFGNADTLAFEFITDCWGHFVESANDGSLALHDTIGCPLINFSPAANGCLDRTGKPFPTQDPITGVEKHVGGTNLLLDMDGNNVMDLLLGDIGVSSIFYVHNCGTQDYAYVDTAYANFPTYDTPIDLFQNPGLTYLDYDNDGIRDLMVGTYESGEEFSENKDPVMWYKNIGSDDAPVFSFRQRGQLSSQMADRGRYSKPCFMDVNADGLLDLIVGHGGIYDNSDSTFAHGLMLYENVGSKDRAAFKLVDTDYLSTSSNPYVFPSPTVGDIDKDGDMDLLIGQQNGEIAYYENTATSGMTATFSLRARAFQGIDAGFAAAPLLHDLDADGDLDLLVGIKQGSIAFYRNIGSSSTPNFLFITSDWGFMRIQDRFGRQNLGQYATPMLLDIDNDNEVELLVGSEAGNVQIYEGVDIALLDTLDFVGNLLDFDFGNYSAPAAAVLDSTGDLNYFVGLGRGGFMLANTLPHKGIQVDSLISSNDIFAESDWEISVFPNPTQGQFTVSRTGKTGELQVQVLDVMGRIVVGEKKLPLGRSTFAIGDQPAGVYFVRVSNGKFSKSITIVKK